MTGERLPNFLVIGAAKSGTTAFFSYLRQHPDVFMPSIKEPHFFAFEGERPAFRGPRPSINAAITDPAEYRALFAAAGDAPAVGEASNLYLYLPEAAERIRRTLPDARLIAVLRQPADRAYSSYLHLKRDGREPAATFEDALALEAERRDAGWGFLWRYRDMGHYALQLRRYLDHFSSEQILIHLYEDFATSPADVMRTTFAFLGVDPSFRPALGHRPNQGGVPRAGWRRTLLSRAGPVRRLAAPLLPRRVRDRVRRSIDRRVLVHEPMSPITRRALTDEYRDEIRELGHLIGRDLSAWLDG
jgi:hypothetical protein